MPALYAQQMTEVEAYPQEVCLGEILQFNGQMFRWPVTVAPLFIRDSEGGIFDPDSEVSPEKSTLYTFYYFKNGAKDTLSVSAWVEVYDPPYLSIAGMPSGEYCPGSRIVCYVDSMANSEGSVRWTLSSGGFLETGDTCTFILDESSLLYARAYNSHCPVAETVLSFRMVPPLSFETEDVLFKDTVFSTCSGCGFSLPDWRSLVDRAIDADIVDGKTGWADRTDREISVLTGMNSLDVKLILTLEKRNRCDTIRTVVEKERSVQVEGLPCMPDHNSIDARLYPCHHGSVEIFGRSDTSFFGPFFDYGFSVMPEWPELKVSEENGVAQGGYAWLSWSFYATECDENFEHTAEFWTKYPKKCRYSHDQPVIIDSMRFSNRIFWDTSRISASYLYCDRKQAELNIYCLQTGMVIEDVRISGVEVDSLELLSGQLGISDRLYYRTVWTVRDSIDRNYDKYRTVGLWVVISRNDGECRYRDTLEFNSLLKKDYPCEPYFEYDMVSCFGDLSRVSYVAPLDYFEIDSVRIVGSDFILDTAYRGDSTARSAEFRSYFSNSQEKESQSGTVRLMGYAHDMQTGKRYDAEFVNRYTVRTCPPEFGLALDPECQTGCYSCPGATLSVWGRMENPSTDWERSRVEWKKRPGGVLKNAVCDTCDWIEAYDLYQESDFVLSVTYNEGDSIRHIDSVPLPLSSFRIDPECVPRFEVFRDSCCGSDSIHWYIYADYYKYYLSEARWDGSVSPVFAVGEGTEDYYYDYVPQDLRPRLHYHTRAETPGIYPYTVYYKVNDTVLSHADTLRISVADNPKVFLQDTVYVCTGSDLDVSQYIDSSMVESLIGIEDPEELFLRNITADRIFSVMAKMKYTCDLGDEMAGELFIEVEQDVYLDCDRSLREVCPLDSTALHVSTNGRVTWIKQPWVDGGWGEPDTLCRESRNRFFYDRVDWERVRYTVFAATACKTPAYLTDSFEAVCLPAVRIHFSDTAACYPDTIRPQAFYSELDPLLETGSWILDGVEYREWPVVPPSSDTVCLVYTVQSSNGCWSVDSTCLFTHRLPVLTWHEPSMDGKGVCVRRGETVSLAVSGADSYSWKVSPDTVPFEENGNTASLVAYADLSVRAEGTELRTGCATTDTVRLRLYPSFLPTSDTVICYRSSVRIQAPREEASSYDWIFEGRQIGDSLLIMEHAEMADTGVYLLVGRRFFCADTQPYRISFHEVPWREFAGKDSLCEGEELKLVYRTDAAKLYPGKAGYRWLSPDSILLSSDTLLVKEDMMLDEGGWYSIVLDYGNCSLTDSLRVSVIPLPYPQWPADTFYCEGSFVLLDASNPSFPGSRYVWNTGGSSSEERIAAEGRHWVELDYLGCVRRTYITVSEHSRPVLPLPSDTLLCRGEECTFVLPADYDAYRWFRLGSDVGEGTGNEQSFRDSLLVYVGVEVMSNGCSNSDTVFVDREFCGRIYFASAFTPDGDRFNDAFGPITTALPEDVAYELSVFNKNGEMVFHSTDIRESWDGTFKGKDCPPGLYVYRCRAVALRRNTDLSSGGNIWLIR